MIDKTGHFQKLICAIGLGTIIASSLIFSHPQKAEAVVPTLDAPVGVSTAATAGSTLSLKIKEYALDKIAFLVAKVVLHRLTASIVDWIRSGFNGNPLFITDWDAFVKDAADQATGVFLKKYFGANSATYRAICSPFRFQILLALSRGGRGYQERMSCTFGTIIGNLENFYSDFNQGGWNAWLTVTNSRNNFYGAVLTSMDELYRQQINAQNRAQTESIMNQGFLSMKKCLQDDFDEATHERTCAKWGTITPGKWIEDQLAKATGSGISELELADELNEIISALISQLINSLINPDRGILGTNASSMAGADISDLENQIRETQNESIRTLEGLIAATENMIRTASTTIGILHDAWQTNIEAKNCYLGARTSGFTVSDSLLDEIDADSRAIEAQTPLLIERLGGARSLLERARDLQARREVSLRPQTNNQSVLKNFALKAQKIVIYAFEDIKEFLAINVRRALATANWPDCSVAKTDAYCATLFVGSIPSGCTARFYDPNPFRALICNEEHTGIIEHSATNCQIMCPRNPRYPWENNPTAIPVTCMINDNVENCASQSGGICTDCGGTIAPICTTNEAAFCTPTSPGDGTGGGGNGTAPTPPIDQTGEAAFYAELQQLQLEFQQLLNPSTPIYTQDQAERMLARARERLNACKTLTGVSIGTGAEEGGGNGNGGGNGGNGGGGNGGGDGGGGPD